MSHNLLASMVLPAPGGQWELHCAHRSRDFKSTLNILLSLHRKINVKIFLGNSKGFTCVYGKVERCFIAENWITFRWKMFNSKYIQVIYDAASLALAAGSIKPLNPSLRAWWRWARCPCIDLMEPSRLSSPMITYSASRSVFNLFCGCQCSDRNGKNAEPVFNNCRSQVYHKFGSWHIVTITLMAPTRCQTFFTALSGGQQ